MYWNIRAHLYIVMFMNGISNVLPYVQHCDIMVLLQCPMHWSHDECIVGPHLVDRSYAWCVPAIVCISPTWPSVRLLFVRFVSMVFWLCAAMPVRCTVSRIERACIFYVWWPWWPAAATHHSASWLIAHGRNVRWCALGCSSFDDVAAMRHALCRICATEISHQNWATHFWKQQ